MKQILQFSEGMEKNEDIIKHHKTDETTTNSPSSNDDDDDDDDPTSSEKKASSPPKGNDSSDDSDVESRSNSSRKRKVVIDDDEDNDEPKEKIIKEGTGNVEENDSGENSKQPANAPTKSSEKIVDKNLLNSSDIEDSITPQTLPTDKLNKKFIEEDAHCDGDKTENVASQGSSKLVDDDANQEGSEEAVASTSKVVSSAPKKRRGPQKWVPVTSKAGKAFSKRTQIV